MSKNRCGAITRRIKALRDQLIRKQNNRCYWCNAWMLPAGGPHPFDDRAATLEHLVPYSRGGTTNARNCVAACHRCNTTRGDHPGPPPHLKTEDANP